jgi:Zn-dependent M28 family amino/carboxypeptidase
VSRHIKHPDNTRFTEMLRDRFREIGGPDIIIRLHRFQHENLHLNNIEAELPGSNPDSLVLVTAHFDSTAASNPGGYHPASDPAPGSDDDASGVAAVLAIAETFAKLRALYRPKHTLRFVLFNAEEQGMIGSKAYARNQAAQRANITAVFHMDMIGYRKAGASPFEFEVHVGYPPDQNIEDRSFVLGRLIQGVAARVSPSLSQLQIYPNREEDGDDPAAGRGDHGSFHERGYAACVLSEDFFAGPRADSPAATPNPNYHQNADREIDYEYAAAIARAVAAGAILAAKTAD